METFFGVSALGGFLVSQVMIVSRYKTKQLIGEIESVDQIDFESVGEVDLEGFGLKSLYVKTHPDLYVSESQSFFS